MSLRYAILQLLRESTVSLSARQIATAVGATLQEAEFDLRQLIAGNDVVRHHAITGLTYAATSPKPKPEPAAPTDRPDELRTAPTPTITDRVYAVIARAERPPTTVELQQQLAPLTLQQVRDALPQLRRRGVVRRIDSRPDYTWWITSRPIPSAAPDTAPPTASPAPHEPAAESPALATSAAPEPVSARDKGRAEYAHRNALPTTAQPVVDNKIDGAPAAIEQPRFTYVFRAHVDVMRQDVDDLLSEGISRGIEHEILRHILLARRELEQAKALTSQ